MKILLIDEDNQRLRELEMALVSQRLISTLRVQNAVYTEPPAGIDAIFMTLPAAERWSPDFKSRKAQVLSTSRADRDCGFPPFVITGVNLLPDDPQDAISQTRIILEEALAAVREHNRKTETKIRSLGFWVMILTNDVTTTELSKLLKEVVLTEHPQTNIH